MDSGDSGSATVEGSDVSRSSRAKPEESDSDGDVAENGGGTRDGHDDGGDSDEDEDGDDDGYDSDTQVIRIADSAASFARHCIASGDISKALVALQSAVEVAEPPSAAYSQCVLLLAQLFQLTKHFDAALECIYGVYQYMPAPYTLSDGLVIIARLHELKGAPALAARWWSKIAHASATEDLASRSFVQQDFVFALDAYRKLFEKHQHRSAVSYAFLFRYLHSALQVLDLEANYRLERQQLAWELAQLASHRREEPQKCIYKHRYADADFYHLRNVYLVHFRAIYNAVFAWDDVPARVIALRWRARRDRRQQQLIEEQRRQQALLAADESQSTKQQKSKATRKKKPLAQTAAIALETSRSRRAPTKSPSSSREPSSSPPKSVKAASTATQHQRSSSKRALASHVPTDAHASERQRAALPVQSADGEADPQHEKQQTNQQRDAAGVVPRTNEAQLSLSSPSSQRHISSAMRRGEPHSRQQPGDAALYENSPTKRKLSAVRNLRTQNLVDELPGLSPSKMPPSPLRDDTLGDEEDSKIDDASRRLGTLLDVYSLPSSPTAAASFLDATGRPPGFADLDLDELERYVRVAHYRARVLTHKHVDVRSLDEAHVKPPWLMALEKTEAMISSLQQQQQQQQSLADDSAAASKPHLTQIHSRVGFQLTAIRKQYKRDFGDTGFTRQLHALVQKLSAWKFAHAPALLAALESAKHAGVREEKQRNLEFFHVHEGGQQQQQQQQQRL